MVATQDDSPFATENQGQSLTRNSSQIRMSHSHVPKNGHKGSRQVHMNREKFNPNRHRDECERIDQSFIDRMTMLCCRRCCDKLQWKVDYGKYEVQTRARKCNLCCERNVVVSYHRTCQKCAWEKILCAKCQKKPVLLQDGRAESAKDDDDDDEDDEEEKDEELNPEEAKARANNRAPSAEAPQTTTKAGGKATATTNYNFVNEPDEDEAFRPYVGLDIRRVKSHMRALQAQAQRDEINNLRERERRTRLRQLKKQAREAKGEAGSDLESDEEPL